MDFMIEEALAGRPSLGKSRKGNLPEKVTLELNGKRLYQLVKFLEEEASKGGDFFRIRWLVMMWEELRNAGLTEVQREARAALYGTAKQP